MVRCALSAPTQAEVEALADFLASLDAACAQASAPEPQLIVTPLGLAAREPLAAALEGLGLTVRARRAVSRWPRLSTALQVRARTPAALRRAVVFEALWAQQFPGAGAEAWTLSFSDATRLAAVKRQVRFPLGQLDVEVPGLLPRAVHLHSFHLADVDDLSGATARLLAAERLLSVA